jgi:hypothetical protein
MFDVSMIEFLHAFLNRDGMFYDRLSPEVRLDILAGMDGLFAGLPANDPRINHWGHVRDASEDRHDWAFRRIEFALGGHDEAWAAIAEIANSKEGFEAA